jgi:6,7-dimethyl-8-ribityllumazine synthase
MNIITVSKNITFPLAIVVSRFNKKVTQLLSQGALDRLKELAFPDEQIAYVEIPGAVEIPVMAQSLAKTNIYKAIICLGAVIQGETNHYDYVCDQVSYGCQRVALDHNIPVIFGVLTTFNEEQALARAGGSKGHVGKEAVDIAVEMVGLLRNAQA